MQTKDAHHSTASVSNLTQVSSGNSWIQPWLFQSLPIGTLVSKMHWAKMTELSDKAMCIVQHIPCMGNYSNLIGY